MTKAAQEDARRQAEGLGLPPEMAAALVNTAPPEPDPVFGVWPENWDVLRVFLAMATQWRFAGMAGVPSGLDYAALPSVLRFLRLRPDEALFERLRVMEAEALEVFADRSRKGA